MQAVEQSAIGVLLSNCVTGMDCRRRWDEKSVNTSHRADLRGLEILSNTMINRISVSYFLLSSDL